MRVSGARGKGKVVLVGGEDAAGQNPLALFPVPRCLIIGGRDARCIANYVTEGRSSLLGGSSLLGLRGRVLKHRTATDHYCCLQKKGEALETHKT
jgi:hypothetical protein